MPRQVGAGNDAGRSASHGAPVWPCVPRTGAHARFPGAQRVCRVGVQQ
nr:hypothetical protein RVX_2391 [Nitratidesulfovibrio sp. HK-II]